MYLIISQIQHRCVGEGHRSGQEAAAGCRHSGSNLPRHPPGPVRWAVPLYIHSRGQISTVHESVTVNYVQIGCNRTFQSCSFRFNLVQLGKKYLSLHLNKLSISGYPRCEVFFQAQLFGKAGSVYTGGLLLSGMYPCMWICRHLPQYGNHHARQGRGRDTVNS